MEGAGLTRDPLTDDFGVGIDQYAHGVLPDGGEWRQNTPALGVGVLPYKCQLGEARAILWERGSRSLELETKETQVFCSSIPMSAIN